jgi:hypothetical protein
MTSRFEVRVAGRLPHASTEVIGSRFGQVDLCERLDSTVLSGTLPDQAALRSLLTLIWDTGSSILSVTLGTVTDDADTVTPAT